MTGGDRPVLTPIVMRRVSSSAVATLGICALLAFAARTTGAGWLVVMLCLLTGGLVVGLAWPRLALLRIGLLATAPDDAVAGVPTPIDVVIDRPRMGLLLRAGDGHWSSVVSEEPTRLPLVSTHRGRYERIEIEIACGAPFGMSWARRRRHVALRRPMFVAPRTRPVDDALPQSADAAGQAGRAPLHRGGEEIRALRDYASGDPMRLVHWPGTARRGALVVKELETPTRASLHIAVELTGDVEGDERACERAMGLVDRALEAGYAITLATASPSGPERAAVHSLREAGRRLAVAGPGRVPSAPAGVAALRVRGGDR